MDRKNIRGLFSVTGITNLSNNTGDSEDPRIAASDNNVYAAWQDNTPGNSEIFFAASSDSGTNFTSPVNLSNTSQDSIAPQIAVSGNNVSVVWVEQVTGGHRKIFFRASTDGGMSFGPTLQLSENTFGVVEYPNVAVSGSNVYVVWRDPSIVKGEIYLKVSTDNGSTFGNIINVSTSPTFSGYPQIAVSGSNVYVVWMEIAVNSDILFRSSNDNGVTFGPTINLSNSSGGVQDEQIAASGSNVSVVWRDNTPGNLDILFRSSNDNGVTFGPTINLSNTPKYSFPPRIAVSGSNVYVVWYDTIDPTSGSEVLFRRSTNGGASFDNAVNLSNNRNNSMYPRIAVSGSNIYIVWANSESIPFGALRSLFFISSKDSGLTFDCNIIDITDALTDSIDPRIALSKSSILVVWSDPPYGPTINSEIFLAQGRR
jgi:hypothetical protein